MTALSLHFKASEFACRCCGKAEMDAEFIIALERLRVQIAAPFIVTSGYRCLAHNAAVGGAEKSAHTLGKAADIAISGGNASRVVSFAPRLGFTGIGIKQHGSFSGRYIHLDTAHSDFTVWTYS